MLEDSSDDDSESEESSAPFTPGMDNVPATERVFLYQDPSSQSWAVVRPSDNMLACLKYNDPILSTTKLGDKVVIVVDSKSQSAKPKYAEQLFTTRKAVVANQPILLQECQKYGSYLL